MINTNPNFSRCDLEIIPSILKEFQDSDGNILEFGTFTGGSTKTLSSLFPDKLVFTIDHFRGLEKTRKNVPSESGWVEGAFSLDNPLYSENCAVPKSIQELEDKFSSCPNIRMIISDVHDLTHPSDYGIGKISICNIDVDIYEPTVSSLEFLTKCEWSEVFIRFDDWHGGESEYDQHERLAFTEWIEKYKYKFEITHGGYIGGVHVKR